MGWIWELLLQLLDRESGLTFLVDRWDVFVRYEYQKKKSYDATYACTQALELDKDNIKVRL